MTREEAMDLLDNLIGMIEDNHDSDYDKALKMAIKALDALDEIRAEIEGERKFQITMNEGVIAMGLQKALEIIDKYKAESEE